MNVSKFTINFAVALFTALLLVSIVILYFCEIRPKQNISDSHNWETVACQLIEVEAKTSDSSPNYYGIYTYSYDNKRYQSDRLSFMPGGIKKRLSVGDSFQGKVNPADPTQAVLFPNETLPSYASWLLYGWVMISALGLFQYLLVRFNKKPLQMDYSGSPAKYYSDM